MKTPDQIILTNLAKLVDVAEESGECKEALQKIANDDKCAVLAFIAPFTAVRISPHESQSASIGLSEEFAIISAIERIKSTNIDKLYLLINSPGGNVSSSYKIAKVLRSEFKHIKTFVPHLAASGGTLMALAANEVVLGPLSHLTPIDVQVIYNGQYVSSYSMARALTRLANFFAKTTPEEAPYPWKAMADKLDPVLMEDWSCYLAEMSAYAQELMKMAGYKPEEAMKIITGLVFPVQPHGFVIDQERAKALGIKTAPLARDIDHLKVMKAWLTCHMLTETQKHIIRYVIPQAKGAKNGPKKSKAKTA